MKKFIHTLMGAVTLTSSLLAIEPNFFKKSDEITYEWLLENGKSSGYTDHVLYFHEIFKTMKVNTLLEFGLGFSTKYFLDSCDKVISVEFINPGFGPDWMKGALDLYRDRPNWVPVSYFTGYPGDKTWAPYKYLGSDSVYRADAFQRITKQSFARINPHYLTELDRFLENLVKFNQIDVVLVDPGAWIRGDLVQLLFNKVPVIVAHDTAERAKEVKDDLYGYSKVQTPENYTEIYGPFSMGTTIWILNEAPYDQLIQALETFISEQ